MKFLLTIPFLLSLAASAAIPEDNEKISYDGYKVFRVSTGDNLATVQEQLASFDLSSWNLDVSQHMDVAVAPERVADFEALNLDVTIMHEDLGADIAAEVDTTASSGMSLTTVQALH